MSRLDAVRDAATHGSFCPKMCNYACPVYAATGREGAAPWGLHVTVAALARDDRPADEAAYRALRGCTGCHACNEACLYDLDVSDEVRAARGAIVDAGVVPETVAEVRDAIEAGSSPYGVAAPELPEDPPREAEVLVMVGCAESQRSIDALATLLETSGVAARFRAPDGCCGALAADLGDTTAAASAGGGTGAIIRSAADGGSPRVMVTDPHCLPAIRETTDLEVRDTASELAALLDEDRLRLSSDALGATTYHDPCVLARGHEVVEAPRALLRAAGAEIIEPEGHGHRTHCSGGGLGFDLLDPDEARLVAERRAEQLAGPGRVVTACGKARRRLTQAGADVEDLCVVLADATERGPE